MLYLLNVSVILSGVLRGKRKKSILTGLAGHLSSKFLLTKNTHISLMRTDQNILHRSMFAGDNYKIIYFT